MTTSRAEQSRAEQSRAEQSRAEQSRATPSLDKKANKQFRYLIRDTITSCFVVSLCPIIAFVLLGEKIKFDCFQTFAQLFSIIPGTFGVYLRRAYYVAVLQDCSKDIGIGFGSQFTKRKVRIARGVSIGGYCMIGMCEIGADTLLGSNIDILSGRHQHGQSDSLGEKKTSTNVFTPVKIGSNCWIGNGAIVMNGVGDNCIIGAGSVVVKEIPAHSLAVGNPAVVKKQV